MGHTPGFDRLRRLFTFANWAKANELDVADAEDAYDQMVIDRREMLRGMAGVAALAAMPPALSACATKPKARPGYYHFFDFDSTSAEGGTGRIISYLKAFVAVGAAFRIVAILDNDVAGHLVLRQLADSRFTLPPNMKLVTYPDLTSLKEYPCVWPSGTVALDATARRRR